MPSHAAFSWPSSTRARHADSQKVQPGRFEMKEVARHVDLLFTAELQFRLASAVQIAVTMDKQALDLPLAWTHGRHKVGYEEVVLRKDQANVASWNMHRSATFLMAVAIKDAIKATVPGPRNWKNPEVKAAFAIARLIRNAFAHSPFNPIWSIDPYCRNRVFEVDNLVSLDTTNLHGVPFNWLHYGGPLALLRLCKYVRFEILKDSKRSRKKSRPQRTFIINRGPHTDACREIREHEIESGLLPLTRT